MGIEGIRTRRRSSYAWKSVKKAMMDPESLYFSWQLNVTHTRLRGSGKVAARSFEEGHVQAQSSHCKWRTSEKPVADSCVKSQPTASLIRGRGGAVAIAYFGANEKSSTENWCSKSLLVVTGLLA